MADDTNASGQPTDAPGAPPPQDLADAVAGQPAGLETAGQADAGTADPDAGTGQAEGQDLAPAGQPPTQPDNAQIAAMTDEQYTVWTQANPAAAKRMALRQTDYSAKTDELKRREEDFKREQQEFFEAVAEGQYGGATPPAVGVPPVQSYPGIVPPPSAQTAGATAAGPQDATARAVALRSEFQQRFGREPQYAEELTAFVAQKAEESLATLKTDTRRLRGRRQVAPPSGASTSSSPPPRRHTLS